MTTRRMLVRGRVQQVGFRAFVRRRARDLGLVGFVRNTAEGTVEVLASGGTVELDRLEDLLHRGPPLAVVSAVESGNSLVCEFEGFEIVA